MLRLRRLGCGLIVGAGAAVVGCGSSGSGTPRFDPDATVLFNPDASASASSGPTGGNGSSLSVGASSTPGEPSSGPGSSSSSASLPGTAITCANPGTDDTNAGSCGTERWDIKTGTDPYTGMVSLVPKANTIATLAALPAAGGGTQRESPTEVTLWQLTDVTLSELKVESDSDYHLVITDGSATMIAEIPAPKCASSSPWLCFITKSRQAIDARYGVSSSPTYPGAVISLRGVGFFDFLHGQNGVAPNAIELHPVLQICFGAGCSFD